MTTAPYVELGYNPTELRPRDIPRVGEFLGSPAQALEAALAVTRAAVIRQMKEEVRGLAEPTHYQLLRISDLAWQAAFWRFRRMSAPVIADAYIRAYREANAGDVPMSVIYDLADRHTEKIGEYFHQSSREGLAEGFNTLVNRQVPAKAAIDQVLEAYGLAPRQMRGYVNSKQFKTPVSNKLPRSLKAKARAYIDKTFIGRSRKLAAQEQHNIDQQAQQLAWMWLQDKGRLPEKAKKLWLTAKDERVCPVCGPLHGKKVGVNEKFVTAYGEFWTPGLHPNCRCVLRLLENRFSKSAFGVIEKDLVGTALADFNQEHPRGQGGRFGTKVRTKDIDEEFAQIVAQPTLVAPVRHISYAIPDTAPAQTAQATQTDEQFAALIAAQPKHRRGLTSIWDSPLAVKDLKLQALAEVSAPEPMIDFAADLAVELRARTRATLATKPKVLTRTKTATMPLDRPAYAVISHHQLYNGELDEISLDHGIVFTTDEIAAAREAGGEIRKVVERHTEDMWDSYAANPRMVKQQDQVTGEMLYADLPTDVFAKIADFYGRTATAHHHDPEGSYLEPGDHPEEGHRPASDESVTIKLRNSHGEDIGPSTMTYKEIGDQFGQRPEDYEFYVVGIDRVPTEEGAVEDVSGSANSKERQFTVDGDYTLKPGSVGRVQHDAWYAATVFSIEPEASVELPEEIRVRFKDQDE